MISMLSSAARQAQLAALITRADQGTTGASVLRFHASATPTAPGPHSSAPMAVVTLGNPCASVVGGVLVWNFSANGMVVENAVPRWAEWLAKDGTQIHIGDVTDEGHDGFYRVSGGQTPEGDNSPLFYAGSTIAPGQSAIS